MGLLNPRPTVILLPRKPYVSLDCESVCGYWVYRTPKREKQLTGGATCLLTIGIETTALPNRVPVADILPATPPG